MAPFDYIVLIIYFLIVIGAGLFWGISRRKSNAHDYFLAGHTLPWWAIGASTVAANISAEQFIGMSGSGFAIGLAIASYEWMAAAALLVVAWFFLPYFLKNKVATMPGFLQLRYGPGVSRLMSALWLALYVFVNLSSVLYLGGLTLRGLLGLSLPQGVWLLAGVGLLYSVAGGLRAVAYTDILQVGVLVAGGLAVTYTALNGLGYENILEGLASLKRNAPEHFHLILKKGQHLWDDGSGIAHDNWQDIPGFWGVFGALWIINLYYWGCNQYIIQRALAAPDIREARKGLLMAAFLKLLMPFLVVIPGVAAYVMYQQAAFDSPVVESLSELQHIGGRQVHIVKPDQAYPMLLTLLPSGLKGLSLAALTAAIISSVASMANSASTLFTLDLFKTWRGAAASESQLVWVGRLAAALSIGVGAFLAPGLARLPQVFQFIQEYSAFISPGVFAVFVAAMLFKKVSGRAALASILLTVPLSALIKWLWPQEPFMFRTAWVFVLLFGGMVLSSKFFGSAEKNLDFQFPGAEYFQKDKVFSWGSGAVILVLAFLYLYFW